MIKGQHLSGSSIDAAPHGDEPLGLEAAEMRALGYWVVDRVVEHFTHISAEPAISTATPGDLQAALGGPPPEDGGDPLLAMQTLLDVALPAMQHNDHPRYFARVPGPASFAGVLGDWLGTGFNICASSWAGGSGPAALELTALDWLRTLLGLPDGTEGIMTSGGSLANMTALAAARVAAGPGVCYLSDQTHSCVLRAIKVLGFPDEHVRVLASDERLRLSPDTLVAAVREDRAAGRRPGFVVATAGTTNTGAVDPLPELAAVCRAEGLWLHVDGAYGASAALCETGRRILCGLELADSLVIDPHKWLFQPIDIGCLFVRRPGILKRAFQETPDYLADVTAHEDEIDLRDRGLELTRRGRGLKLWLSFRTYGVRRIAEAIERGLALAEHAQGLIESDKDWEVVTAAQLGIVTFARRGAGYDELQELAAAITREGYATLTCTRLRGRPVLRLCTINPRTTTTDLATTLQSIGIRLPASW
jgi:aromatic-L-amino-acid/L-tryptophan decarboxylase